MDQGFVPEIQLAALPLLRAISKGSFSRLLDRYKKLKGKIMTFGEGFAFVVGAFVLAAALALVNGWAILWAWSVLHPATALPMNVVNICAIAVAYYTLKGIFSGGDTLKVKS